MMKPLSGIRILDASHVIAGPFASYQLGLMGAEVIRIDRIKNHDFVRFHGGTESMKDAGLGASYVSQNAGKSCIQLDLKDPRSIDIFKRLAATSDIVLENFRPGVMNRLGLGYEAISKIKKDIIYCSMTGYGPSGPLRDAPAYDHIVQGVSGLMSVTGTKETGPLRSGVPITDYLAGYNGALAILAALLHRNNTGEGQHLQVTMLGSALPVLGAALVDYQTTGNVRDLMGNQPFSDSPFSGRFDTADGQLVMTTNTAQQCRSLIETLKITTLDEELAGAVERKELTGAQKRNAKVTLHEVFMTDIADNWIEKLTAASVPAGKVASLSEVATNPQNDAIGSMDKIEAHGLAEIIDVPGLAFSSNLTATNDLPAPEPAGSSTCRILKELGLSKDEIDDLAKAGAIAGPNLPEPEQ
jgi:crotonobetainyl-CoA:carnitine CoA-transferase CaiB-like acyl-CoA transferase